MKDMKSALKKSLITEEEHIKDRFSKADQIFAKTEPIKNEEKKTVEPVIRDTFSMPKEDSTLIYEIKLKCMKAGIDTTKSEIVRAGIRQLATLSQNDLYKLVGAVEKLKPGPQKNSKP